MKKSLTLVFAGLLAIISLTVKGQDKPAGKNVLSAGYGVLSSAELADEFPNMLDRILGVDSVKSATGPNYGTLSFGYQRILGKVLSLGVTASVNPILSDLTFKKGTTATSSTLVISLMPKLVATYAHHGVFSAYSAIAVGVAYWNKSTSYANGKNEKTTNWRVGYQVSLIGVRLGKDVGGFLELGYGYEGLLRIGLSAKL